MKRGSTPRSFTTETTGRVLDSVDCSLENAEPEFMWKCRSRIQ